MPPSGLLSLARECPQVVAFGLVGYAIKLTQVPDVTHGGRDVAGFHTAHLARGAQQAGGHLLYCQAFFVTEGAQQGAEFAAANCGTPYFWQRGLLPLRSGGGSSPSRSLPSGLTHRSKWLNAFY